jgi:hypothetical protein
MSAFDELQYQMIKNCGLAVNGFIPHPSDIDAAGKT